MQGIAQHILSTKVVQLCYRKRYKAILSLTDGDRGPHER